MHVRPTSTPSPSSVHQLPPVFAHLSYLSSEAVRSDILSPAAGICSYITPAGQGFLPRQTAAHHQVNTRPGKAWSFVTWGSKDGTPTTILTRYTSRAMQANIVQLVQQALKEAGVQPQQISCIAYTKVGLASLARPPRMHFSLKDV